LTTAAATVVAIAVSPIFGHYNTIIEGLNKLISYAAPPITAVVLGGIFTRWATARAAAVTLVLGMGAGMSFFLLDWFKLFSPDYMLATFFNFVGCFLLLYLLSAMKPVPLSAAAESCIWPGWRTIGSGSRVVLPTAVAVICVFIALYVEFW